MWEVGHLCLKSDKFCKKSDNLCEKSDKFCKKSDNLCEKSDNPCEKSDNLCEMSNSCYEKSVIASVVAISPGKQQAAVYLKASRTPTFLDFCAVSLFSISTFPPDLVITTLQQNSEMRGSISAHTHSASHGNSDPDR
jgi:hypothetical protein